MQIKHQLGKDLKGKSTQQLVGAFLMAVEESLKLQINVCI